MCPCQRRLGSGHLLVQTERCIRALWFAQAPHLTWAPCLSLSSFCAVLEFVDDSVGVLVKIVLSEDAVAAVPVVFCGLWLLFLFCGMLLLLWLLR